MEAQQSISIFWRHWLFVPRAARATKPKRRPTRKEEVRDELLAVQLDTTNLIHSCKCDRFLHKLFAPSNMLPSPDFVVILCLRTILSCVGLILIVSGIWRMERKWEIEGSAAFDQAGDAESSGYNPAPEGVDIASVSWEDIHAFVEIPQPVIAMVGVSLWALSFLVSGSGDLEFLLTPWSIASAATVLLMGYLILYPLRQSSQNRNLFLKQQTLAANLVCGGFLAYAGRATDNLFIVTLAMNATGVFLWIPSYWIMWRQGKMGKLWDLEGRPNYNICFQNFGGHMLVYAIFLLWVGTSAVPIAEYHMIYIPFYLSIRSLVVVLTISLILVPALLAIDYAFDSGSEPVEGSYSLDGITFTHLLGNKFEANIIEGPTLVILSWLALGVSCFIPFYGGLTVRRAASAVICVAIGLVYGLKLLPSFHNAFVDDFRKSVYLYFALLVSLSLALGINAGATRFLSAFGVALLFAGQGLSMHYRKKGETWVLNRAVHTKPVMFSIGQPSYMIGWIILALALAVPM